MEKPESTQTSKYPQGTSEYIAFLDECGDHSLRHIDKDFPIYVLSTVIINREDYGSTILPKLNQLKLKYWDHEGVNLHSRDIRRGIGPYSILRDKRIRTALLEEISTLIQTLPFDLVISDMSKLDLPTKNLNVLDKCIIQLQGNLVQWMKVNKQTILPVTVESRGKKEDRDFKTIFKKQNHLASIPLLFLSKHKNIAGIQIADLCAYPVARNILNPNENNLPFQVIQNHLFKSYD
jgi:hypothetical protein